MYFSLYVKGIKQKWFSEVLDVSDHIKVSQIRMF